MCCAQQFLMPTFASIDIVVILCGIAYAMRRDAPAASSAVRPAAVEAAPVLVLVDARSAHGNNSNGNGSIRQGSNGAAQKLLLVEHE